MRHLQRVLLAARVGLWPVELLKAGSVLAHHDVGTWGAGSWNCELVGAGAKLGRRECRPRPPLWKTGRCVMFGYRAGWGLDLVFNSLQQIAVSKAHFTLSGLIRRVHAIGTCNMPVAARRRGGLSETLRSRCVATCLAPVGL
jgi:hypothetical protein